MPSHPMSDEEVLAFLDRRRRPTTAKLATVRADGRPHVAPVWFALDLSTAGDRLGLGDLVFNTGADTLKGRDILPRSPGGAVRRRRTAAVLLRDHRGDRHGERGPGRGRPAGPPSSAAATWERSGPRSTGAATACPASCWSGCGPTHIVAMADLAD